MRVGFLFAKDAAERAANLLEVLEGSLGDQVEFVLGSFEGVDKTVLCMSPGLLADSMQLDAIQEHTRQIQDGEVRVITVIMVHCPNLPSRYDVDNGGALDLIGKDLNLRHLKRLIHAITQGVELF